MMMIVSSYFLLFLCTYDAHSQLMICFGSFCNLTQNVDAIASAGSRQHSEYEDEEIALQRNLPEVHCSVGVDFARIE